LARSCATSCWRAWHPGQAGSSMPPS
jgi:hypothetical protein